VLNLRIFSASIDIKNKNFDSKTDYFEDTSHFFLEVA
jgi:hypothetical protein